ncbi:hypothetical protein CTAYLR_005118 [Chrysophaeum taylorii]|uniref:Uncharacterized protein n=1 Tax=Chrysophaeum taylorii TaxID=2483200 RepID=A0AAD7XIW7_9STRA|nr:hypothetical protein CTAYLR_005118 [Chrysophaeum taylorii]
MLCVLLILTMGCALRRVALVPTAETRGNVVVVATKTTKPRVIFCLGGPGAGKGTQCERLADFGYVHLSAGDLLRRERASGSADGDLIESYISEGRIVPVALSLGLLRKEMERLDAARFVIDGFPRNQDNLDGWKDLMTDFHVDCVLFYEVPVEELVKRMLSRGETSGRSDDTVSVAEKRIATFNDATMPLIDHWERTGEIKVIRIPGDRDVEEVWHLTKAAIEPYLAPCEE